MAMNLAKETFSTERKYFEAGTDIRVTTAREGEGGRLH